MREQLEGSPITSLRAPRAPGGYSPHVGSPHETDSIPLTEYCPIFRVPEYSELSIVSALGAHEFRSVELVGSEYSALPI
jgi:hypothetical protein